MSYIRGGFTLVELMVTLTLIVLLGLLTIPSYAQFQQQQRLRTAERTVESTLYNAFFSARSHPVPSGVRMEDDGTQIIAFVCDDRPCTTRTETPQDLPPGVFLRSGAFEILFHPPHGDIDPASFPDATLGIILGNSRSTTVRVHKVSGLIEILP